MRTRYATFLVVSLTSVAVATAGHMGVRDARTTLRLAHNGQATCTIVFPAQAEGWRDLTEQIASKIAQLDKMAVPVAGQSLWP